MYLTVDTGDIFSYLRLFVLKSLQTALMRRKVEAVLALDAANIRQAADDVAFNLPEVILDLPLRRLDLGFLGEYFFVDALHQLDHNAHVLLVTLELLIVPSGLRQQIGDLLLQAFKRFLRDLFF